MLRAIVIFYFATAMLNGASALGQPNAVWIKIWERDTLTTEIAISRGLAESILSTDRSDSVIRFGNINLPLESLTTVVYGKHDTFTILDHRYDTKLSFSAGTFEGFNALGVKGHRKSEHTKEFTVDIFERGKESISFTMPISGINAIMGQPIVKAQSSVRNMSGVESAVWQGGGAVYIKEMKHGSEVYIFTR